MTATTSKKTMSLPFPRPAAMLAVLPLTAMLALGGCAVAQKAQANLDPNKPIDSLTGEYKETDAHLNAAATNALAAGRTADALEAYKELHKRHPHDMAISIGYAQMLRKTGKAQKAADLLDPYTAPPVDADGRPVASPPPLDPQLSNELAADRIALGDFDGAKDLLDPLLAPGMKNPWQSESTNLMRVVLDAQGAHKSAEKMFRVALHDWKGSKTSVMNNLALCLASQAKFDESLLTLRQAQLDDPDNKTIARNIQIVSDLRKNVVPLAPVRLHGKKKGK